MLIIDDRLTLRVLADSYTWLPDGHDPARLATTAGYLYRLHLAATATRTVAGVHTRAFQALSETGQRTIRARLLNPASHLEVLDPRPNLHTAALIANEIGRLSHLQAETLAAAIHHDAALALTAASDGLVRACQIYGIELHELPAP